MLLLSTCHWPELNYTVSHNSRESEKCVPVTCLSRKGNRELIYSSPWHSLPEDPQGTWFDWKRTFVLRE